MHGDIRAENILIATNRTAKLANFRVPGVVDHNHYLERVRCCAPELFERVPDFKYDQKCEVYSFGVLLWEIAEERIPYQGYDDFDIMDMVCNRMYREPFSENSKMPEEFRELQFDGM